LKKVRESFLSDQQIRGEKWQRKRRRQPRSAAADKICQILHVLRGKPRSLFLSEH